ncbi:MarR family winged helix-turn-helix transcriptional regulator [Allocoprobacillus halotolerans]|uniref:MarR family winged helix-turn-helix transcriptional regulator n=1 Tax=Allocoprobacillus halotolerans TaxID=2944914 RepID=A0ABY5HZH3_9FIRM|nr:MarR family winged helix-turn-helix transcriptional regulator [Allocoprobacillus halotolerans]UTY38483.1 MarR family winged helix-turn-helix transcriptional regulator [Allocoprobacillus halotolerans]
MFRDPLGYRLKTLSNLMKKNMDKHFGPQHDRATMMQTWIIGFVQLRDSEGKDTFQKDIEEEFSINRSTTSEMLTLMSKRKLIERVPVDYDGRLKKIVLTQKSLEIHEWINQTMKQVHEKLTEGLSSEEIETFIRISDKMIHNLSKDDVNQEDKN